MKIILNRLNTALAFEAVNEEGITATFDANPAIGGEGLGLRPMEMLAASMASCASIDVLLILKKKRITLAHYRVEIQATRVDAVPAVFETIHLQFQIAANDPIEQVQKAVDLSVEKYCSVSASLSKTIKITHSVSIQHT
jgi:putative redox protein